jgi:7-carboxy-7-deazaguanine synthase
VRSVNVSPERSLTISEIFGPTIQGEGRSQGRSVVFLRLGLCNLDCSWCDTPYTWDWTGKNGVKYDKAKELTRKPVREILETLLWMCDHKVTRVVISGGEPMIQQKPLADLIAGLYAEGVSCEIETNGTIEPSPEMVNLCEIGALSLNCSPKLNNSGVTSDDRINPQALETIMHTGAIFKFVVSDNHDLDEIDQLLETTLTGVDKDKIYIMPEGTTQQKIASRLAWAFDKASQRGWSLSPRLHVLAFNDMRGI